MPTLPSDLAPIIFAFQGLMLKRTWDNAVWLLVGAILAPGRRTVCSLLRIMGLRYEKHFQNFHRVLNRAAWNPRAGSRILLGLLIEQFGPKGPLLFGLDDTIERRWGPKIRARGIYRDPVRSSESHLVKASGLRWLSLMLLVRIPWAERVWALPVLTSLAPSERYYQNEKKRNPKTVLDWARQQCCQLRRWLPRRKLTMVADGAFASLRFLHDLQRLGIICITRLRLDARLYQPAPARSQHRTGRPRIVGARQPSLAQWLGNGRTHWTKTRAGNWYGNTARTIEYCSGTAVWYHGGLPPVPIRWVLVRDPKKSFAPLALLSTEPAASPLSILGAYVHRWRVEVTFEEARAHLGLETQRQWSDKAITRSTPLLLALFSIVTLMAARLTHHQPLPMLQSAWYAKSLPTFSDALAAVRRCLWAAPNLPASPPNIRSQQIPAYFLDRFADALCYAA
jgi:hypothetical protein